MEPVGVLFGNDINTIWVALIVSVVSPGLLSLLTNKQRRKEKAADWMREDIVAEKAAVAAELLAIDNRAVAKRSAETIQKLDVIHVLVNSNMTAAMQSELDATVRERAMMTEVVDLKKAAGREPTIEVLAAIRATDIKIVELCSALRERLNQAS
jgi:hypothetical protein